MKTLFTGIVACAIIALASCQKIPIYQEPLFDGNNYVIDFGSLREKEPVFYSVSFHDKRVSFFVVKVDGDVQSYFNACNECYPRKLGYYFEGGFLICKFCNERYPVDALKGGIGSCYPVYLKGTLRENRYLITREALGEGFKFF